MRKKALIYAVLMTLVITPLQAVNALTVTYDQGSTTSSGTTNTSGNTNTSGGVSSGTSYSGSGVGTNDPNYQGVPGAGSQTGSTGNINTSGGVSSAGSTGTGSTGNTNTSGGVSTTDSDYKGVPGAGSESGNPNTSGGVSTGGNGYDGVPGYDGRNPGPSQCSGHYYPKDIDGHWAEIYIRRLYDLCILEGYNDGSFHPNQYVTRAELTKMALYARGIKPNNGCYDNDCGSPFTDLDSWQGKWIRPAWDKGIVEGYTHNRFRPNNSITRAEAVKVVLATYGEGKEYTQKSFFKDVKGWSVGWIERAHKIGLVQGIGNGNFDPNRPVTRAEAAKIIAKMMEHWDTRIR